MSTQWINEDTSVRAIMRTGEMEWVSSPSPFVHRKRVYLSGPVEAGLVTSVVRYSADSAFHNHGHPQGEEFYVLEGTFSDESGDYPTGSYVLNPEGFEHTPFSKAGCIIVVRLRQHAGPRTHLAIQTMDIPWTTSSVPGLATKVLMHEDGFTDCTWMEQLQPRSTRPFLVLPLPSLSATVSEQVCELFVIQGALSDASADEQAPFTAGTWLRYPPGAVPDLNCVSDENCVLYVRLFHASRT
jgi:quercetin dioxygenase-like cupin family protein